MAITYPISMPTVIGPNQVTLTAENVVSSSMSPFTFQEQLIRHAGERWSASVSIPPVHRDLAEPWIAFLLSLNGRQGTFLLGDPNAKSPRGGATYVTVNSANAQASELTIASISGGTLKAGDYFQLGSGDAARLYKILNDVDSAGDTINVWPRLRFSVATGVSLTLNDTVGRFRLSDSRTSWNINEASSYGISFDCVEAI